MNQEQPTPEILARIKENIGKKNPRSRWYGRVLSCARITAVIAIVLISTLTLTLFLSDIIERISGSEIENHSFLENIPAFILGFFLISLIGVVAVYIIYRTTDWPFNKERMGIFVGSCVIIVSLSATALYLSENELTPVGDFLDGFKDQIEETLQLQPILEENYYSNIMTREGTIIEVTSDEPEWIIVIESEGEQIQMTLERRFGEFHAGEHVRVSYELSGKSFDVERIERIQ